MSSSQQHELFSSHPSGSAGSSGQGSPNFTIRLNGQKDSLDQIECGVDLPLRRPSQSSTPDEQSTSLGGGERSSGESSRQRKSSNPLVRLMLRLTRKQEEEKKREITLDMLQPSRYKPNNLQQMAEDTKFSKREVRSLYRAFKQECPNGIVDEDTFKDVYEKIFPLGDASHYAHLVFAAIDRERTGGITFGDFMDFLSVITKGTTEDKLLWAFSFYDVNHDGVITKEEMLKVTDSIHELMGGTNAANNMDAHAHVERIFQTMDLNRDGLITMDEFIQYCTTQQDVRNSMMVFP